MTDHHDNRPPLFGSWTGWYVFVLVFLFILIVLFYLLTKRFA